MEQIYKYDHLIERQGLQTFVAVFYNVEYMCFREHFVRSISAWGLVMHF